MNTQNPRERWKVGLVYYGRRTQMGAFSTLVVVRVERGEARVERYNYSRSGRHWDEVLYITPDFTGVVAQIDISNSGKHRCQLVYWEDGQIVAVHSPPGNYWMEPCPVCSQIPEER